LTEDGASPERSNGSSVAAPRPSLTLKDVARLAGVSTATVSLALGDDPRITSATKQVVRDAATKLNYVPNSLGRGLRSRRLGSIALVVPQSSRDVFSHPYFMEILDGVSEVANARDLMLVVSTAPSASGDRAYLRLLESRRADGVIVASASMDDRNVDRLALSGYPVAFLGRYPRDPSVCAVGVDDSGGATAATTHLIEAHGSRAIAHVAAPLGHQAGADRLHGYQLALGRHGLPYDERLVVEGDVSEASGEGATDRLMRSGMRFDAVFAGNDEMALGVLRALERAGLGDGIPVVGFDDIRLASAVRPALTTVRQPMRETGRLAAERLVGMLDGRSPEPRQVVLPTELVVRASCGCGEASVPMG
jgi:LacI family transcriptional regulator, repressor for deo operon, udp, cdd, tsx, nupC, and nupG